MKYISIIIRLIIKSICIMEIGDEMFVKFLLVLINSIFLIRFIINIGNIVKIINVIWIIFF